MKNFIFLFAVVALLASCGQPQTKKEKISNVVKEFGKVNKKEATKSAKTIDLPDIGKINLSNFKQDSTNHYSFESCKGSVIHFSSKNTILVTDSLSCGDEAYVYTSYLLNNDNSIRYVDVVKLGLSLVPGSRVYWYVRSEKVYNFSTSPATLMVRADTLENLPVKALDKPFKNEAMEDMQNRRSLWNMKFKGLWRLK